MDDPPATDMRKDTWSACPFVDQNDNRCTSRFSLGRIDQAFGVCFGAYRACPMFHRITAETERMNLKRAAAAETTIITVTADGRTLPLRPTGT